METIAQSFVLVVLLAAVVVLVLPAFYRYDDRDDIGDRR